MSFIILYLNTSKITIGYFHDFKVLFFLYDTINIKKLFSYLLQLPDPSNTIDKEGRSESPNDELRQSELNRMASIRLHQKLVQSHDKQWPSGSEVNTQTDKQTKYISNNIYYHVMTKEYRKSGQNIFTPMQGLKDLIQF